MKLRKAIAVLLVLIFALIALPTLFLKSISGTYLNPNFYEGKIIDKSHEYMVNFLIGEVSYTGNVDIEDIVKRYVTPEAIGELAKDFTTQLKGINDGRKKDSIVISLMPIKQNMDLIVQELAEEIVEKTPLCEFPDDEGEVDISYVNGKPVCVPAMFNKAEIVRIVQHELEKELNNIVPGEFTLELAVDEEDQATFRQILSFIDYLQLILPLIMLVLLLLIALFVYSPYSLISKFTGVAILLAGVFGLVASQILSQIPSLTITQVNFPELLAEEISYLNEIYDFFLGFIVERMSIYSLYMLGMGIVLVLFGLYLHHFNEHAGENSQ